MEDKEQEVKELNYKVTFRDLKPRICVYGIDRGRKELYSQKALITWDMQIKAGYLPPPSDYPDKKAEPNRISNFKMNYIMSFEDLKRERLKTSEKSLEGMLCEHMKNENTHLVKVDDPNKIESVIKRHGELFCGQAIFASLKKTYESIFQAYIDENPSLSPYYEL